MSTPSPAPNYACILDVFQINKDYKVEFKIKCDFSSRKDQGVFSDNDGTWYNPMLSDNAIYVRWYQTVSQSFTLLRKPTDKIQIVRMENRRLVINDEVYTLNSNKTSEPTTCHFFTFSSTSPSPFMGAMYYFKVWNENDVLVNDFVAALDTKTGSYGLYDKVNKSFRSSSYAIKFIGGEIIGNL